MFHSLSKRPSAPGLRSGFVAGDAKIKQFNASQLPFGNHSDADHGGIHRPLNDDVQSEANRDLYRAKLISPPKFWQPFCFYRPQGVFIWFDVGDDEAATKKYGRKKVKVIPALPFDHGPTGDNPGARLFAAFLVRSETREGQAD
ncbi:hypothetical protein [Thalassospira alkalitolerans]|uniref:hypothetical protein n=1 Tax=Thalassospira alkalitolerans TaxID=1293890 RepID=UPI003AA8A594